MSRYTLLAKKVAMQLLQSAIVLIGITIITFLILYLSPRNPAELWLAGSDGNVGTISAEAIAEQERIMGLDQPFIVQYGNWLGNALRGDLGMSYTSNKPVLDELLAHMRPTVLLTVFSLAITVAVSVPLGIYCAVHKDKALDNTLRVFSFVGISVPSFLMALLLLWLVCMKLGLLPVIAGAGISGLILPIAVLVIQCTSKMIRQVRAIVLEQLDKPYVEGAVARGVGMREILFTHVLKNSAVAILTCISVYVGIFLGGATIIEGIFSVNGLGRLAVSSVARLDYNVLLGFVLWCAVVYLVVNLAVDIVSTLIDPRIRYERA